MAASPGVLTATHMPANGGSVSYGFIGGVPASAFYFKATAYSGYRFVRWTFENFGNKPVPNTIMNDLNSQVNKAEVEASTYIYEGDQYSGSKIKGTAYFAKTSNPESESDKKYTVTTNSSPTAGGTTSGDGTYSKGTKVTLTATAKKGYKFVRWRVSDGTSSTNNSISVTVNSNITATAYFEKLSGLILRDANPPEQILYSSSTNKILYDG